MEEIAKLIGTLLGFLIMAVLVLLCIIAVLWCWYELEGMFA